LNGAQDGKRDRKPQKQSYGRKGDGFYRAGKFANTKPLIIAEGVETMLSAVQLAGGPSEVAGIAACGSLHTINQLPKCCEVIIARDRNKPDHDIDFAMVARELAGRIKKSKPAIRVRIVRTPKSEWNDWNDVLQEVDDPKEVWDRQLERAEEVEAPACVSPITREEFMALKVEPPVYYLNPILRVAHLLQFHGPTKHGKSRFAFSMAAATYCSTSLLNWQCEKQARVLYVDGELPQEDLQPLLNRIPDSDGRLLVLSRYELLARGLKLPDIRTAAGRAEYTAIIEEWGVDVLILDSYSTLVGGDENELDCWQDIQEWLMSLRGMGISVILIMHEGINTGRARGPTKRTDVFDGTMRIERLSDRDTEEEAFYLIEPKLFRSNAGAGLEPIIAKLNKYGPMQWAFVEQGKPKPDTPRMSAAREREERVRKMKEEGYTVRQMADSENITTQGVRNILKRITREENEEVEDEVVDEDELV
jgi:hypothetical protein